MRKFLCAVLFMLSVSACHAENINVTAAIFPLYDWTRELAKGVESVKVNLLLKNGADLHNYQPSVKDMAEIATCDMFIYIGGESDEWVEDALKNVVNKSQITINALEILGDLVKHEEHIEGMEHSHEHHEHDHEHEESDEHVWLSLRNAEIICRYIASKLTQIDPADKEIYMQNLERYVKSLSELDTEYSRVINASARKILLFGDRFPFRYLCDDYALKYYAAFSGCSAESEASFETVKFLADKVNELELPCVMNIEGTRHKIAQTVIANTNAKSQKILILNSMQSINENEINNGASYLNIMRENLEVIKQALN